MMNLDCGLGGFDGDREDRVGKITSYYRVL